MTSINRIRQKVALGEYEFAIPHFFEEMANDGLAYEDVESAIANGRIRRKFKRDPRGIRYEVVGKTADGRRVAIICRIKSTGKLLLITTYVMEDK